MTPASDRIRRLYEGERGAWWERIERGRPATWAEENTTRGRTALQQRLIECMGSLAGRRVLDAGCGFGTFAAALATAGARVVGVDLVSRFLTTEKERAGLELVSGDVVDRIADAGDVPFDDVVLMEVLEDYEIAERLELLRRIGACGAPRIWLAFRSAEAGAGRLWDLLPTDPRPAIDPVELLRFVHTRTPYRQRRRHTVQRRNYRAHLAELVREDDP
jgi:SAM-dependent methyltransferase